MRQSAVPVVRGPFGDAVCDHWTFFKNQSRLSVYGESQQTFVEVVGLAERRDYVDEKAFQRGRGAHSSMAIAQDLLSEGR